MIATKFLLAAIETLLTSPVTDFEMIADGDRITIDAEAILRISASAMRASESAGSSESTFQSLRA